MEWIAIIYTIFLWIANMFFCGWLANEKNRDGVSWACLALLFGLLTTLILIGAPEKEETEENQG